jgi:glycosyltransferase involved in cell wall biosynthesis
LTYLEAQASGVPVVARNFGGVSACIVDGVSGFLCDPADENSFARALNAMVQDDALRRTLSASARSWVTAERSLPAAARRLRDIIGCVRQ